MVFSANGLPGASLSRNPDEAEPTVFPDKYQDLRPVMPHVAKIQEVAKKTLRIWIRDYLNSEWRTWHFFTTQMI